ncbi:MAG: hypothetical protein AB9891_16380 [Anaerolineaceae bacterium]
MKTPRIVLALAVFAVPLLFRTLWFYHGVYQPSLSADVPDFSESSLPFPNLSTPIPTAENIQHSGQITLIDQQHGNLFSFSEIGSLVDEIQRLGAGWDVLDFEEDLSQRLKRAESFFVIAPTVPFSDHEIAVVKDFTDRGGRLLIITDPTRDYGYYDSSMSSDSNALAMTSSTTISNRLLNPYNISISNDYLYNLTHNEGNFRHILFSNFADSPLTSGLKEVIFYSAHSIQVDGGALISADKQTLSSLTDEGGSLAAAVMSADGKVAALGDLTFLASPYSQVADNQKLIRNLAAFLVGSARLAELADFPHLFERNVMVVHDSTVDMSTATIAQVAALEELLRPDGYTVNLAEEAKTGSDLVVIGIFPPSEEIETLIEGFHINFSVDGSSEEEPKDDIEDDLSEVKNPIPTPTPKAEDSATPIANDGENSDSADEGVLDSFDFYNDLGEADSGEVMDVPGFGEVPMSGVSLILFDTSSKQNSVFLLADSEESIQALLSRFFSGDLTGCLIKGNIAVCGSAASG